MKVAIYVFLVLCAGVFFSCTSLYETESKLNRDIKLLLDTMTQSDKSFEALGLALVTPIGQEVFYAGHLIDGAAPSAETQWEIASITKTFTGLLLAKAIKEGLISLDDDIRDYLSGDLVNLQNNGSFISVRDLATHRSGLPIFFPIMDSLFRDTIDWDILPFQFNEAQTAFTKEDFLTCLEKYELPWVPGSQVMYSNPGSNLIAIMLENVYQSSFDSLIMQNFFLPLEMRNSFPSIRYTQENQVAKGKNANGIEMPFRVAKEINAEGGIISSIPDISKYMNYLLNEGFKNYPLLLEEIAKDSFEYHRGLFWQVERSRNEYVIYQMGGAYGTSSYMTIYPSLNIAVFSITNASGDEIHNDLEKLNQEIVEIVKEHKN